ncbi:MAG: FHA domain-containing protein [Deltaproteobacteria bacterium]|nr:FHA domain-containing protein [Deltaproteobacteria bacterium]
MSTRGAPTGKWETIPKHLSGSEDLDLKKAGARFLVRRPGVKEVEIKIDKSEFVIGRQASAVDLVLDDELVSRRHAALSMDERGYFHLVDLGSRNRITFAGRPVRRLNLVDGDVFSIGKTEFTFRANMSRSFEAPATPSSPPPPRGESIAVPEPEEDIEAIDEGGPGLDPPTPRRRSPE